MHADISSQREDFVSICLTIVLFSFFGLFLGRCLKYWVCHFSIEALSQPHDQDTLEELHAVEDGKGYVLSSSLRTPKGGVRVSPEESVELQRSEMGGVYSPADEEADAEGDEGDMGGEGRHEQATLTPRAIGEGKEEVDVGIHMPTEIVVHDDQGRP